MKRNSCRTADQSRVVQSIKEIDEGEGEGAGTHSIPPARLGLSLPADQLDGSTESQIPTAERSDCCLFAGKERTTTRQISSGPWTIWNHPYPEPATQYLDQVHWEDSLQNIGSNFEKKSGFPGTKNSNSLFLGNQEEERTTNKNTC